MHLGGDRNGRRAGLIIELKQWDARTVVVDGHNIKFGAEVHSHPSDQALGYREYLEDLSPAFADRTKQLRSCAYLHRTIESAAQKLLNEPFSKLLHLSPLFLGDQQHLMATWISELFFSRPDSAFVDDFESDDVRISRKLFDTVANAVRGQKAWTLLDEQRTAFNEIMKVAGSDSSEKHLVLITGGPGTGKSAIAMQVMGELCRRKVPVVHVTNSKSFTTVMQSLIAEKRSALWGTRAVASLFRLSHGWVKRKDPFEVAICDEAHRFREATSLL